MYWYPVQEMTIEMSYTEARARLAELWDRVVRDRETVRIRRRGTQDVVLVSADEFAGLEESAHLFRSPRNATRLLAAYEEALAGEGTALTLEELRARVALDSED
jgi:antitoxin YefM